MFLLSVFGRADVLEFCCRQPVRILCNVAPRNLQLYLEVTIYQRNGSVLCRQDLSCVGLV